MMSSSAYNGNGDSDNRSIYSSYSTLTIPTACSEYARLKQETFASGILFEDHDFPADVASLYHRHKPSLGPIVWKRPREICQNPKFITKSATRFDIKQGQLGDCWLLTAVSCLTITPRLFRNVVPPNQFFHRNYAGMFVFRFWQYGEWVEVCVDDRLPTYQGQLVYMHSGDPTEFWCSLLEKAYAKLYGSYEALNGSYTAWALQDLTGGVAESYGLDQGSEEHPTFVYTVMGSVIPRSSLLAASIVADDRRQKRLACGLLTQHTYSVTGIATINTYTEGRVRLVRLCNPSGDVEWNGLWHDKSDKWRTVPNEDKASINLTAKSDGEFWMSLDDFYRFFTHLDILYHTPEAWYKEPSLQGKRRWQAAMAHRQWVRGFNAGGSNNFPDLMPYNPQFHLYIQREDVTQSTCNVVVSVMQHDRNPSLLHAIGFYVYRVQQSAHGEIALLDREYLSENTPIVVKLFEKTREAVAHFTVPAGDYIVMPCTQKAHTQARFLLRVLTDVPCQVSEVNEDNTYTRRTDTIIPQKQVQRQLVPNPVERKFNKIYAEDLQKILKEALPKHYIKSKEKTKDIPLEFCKFLIMIKDTTMHGCINPSDVAEIVHSLQRWKTLFMEYDRKFTGTIWSYTLRNLLKEAGFTVSNKVLEVLVLRFANNELLTFESFVLCLVKLHLAYNRYITLKEKNKDPSGSLEEVILTTAYS